MFITSISIKFKLDNKKRPTTFQSGSELKEMKKKKMKKTISTVLRKL